LRNFIIFVSTLILFLIGLVQPVSALTIPQFPSCENPSGKLVVQYNNGTHGVPGDARSFTGSDRVFRINDQYLIQCLCPDGTSNGIQSNWWRYDNLTDDDLKIVTRQGWIHIPNGSLWGLDNAAYLVKNQTFSCVENGVGGLSRSAQVLGVSTLALTGSSWLVFSVLGFGLILVLISKLIKLRHL
jgi:hypothetical protein